MGEVLVELLGEVPGEVLALPAATSQLPTPPVTVNERHREYPEVSLSAYRLSCRQTLNHHLAQLGAEGKAAARIFCRRLLKSGEKISITGDLWSDN